MSIENKSVGELIYKSENRLSRYLGDYEFFPNNIDFRIYSSRAIEKWKNVQAFQLNQITNGKFKFHQHKKEILLLKYDLWSRFIYEVENMIIDLSHSYPERQIDDHHIDAIIELANKTSSVYKEVILREDNNQFEIEFSGVWLLSHELIYEMMIDQIEGLRGFNYNIAFTSLVDIVSSVMQYTLIELHELNALFCFYGHKGEACDICPDRNPDQNLVPFMIITETDGKYYSLTGRYLVVERFKIYKKYFDIDSVFFKNYSGKRIPREIFDTIEKTGVDIKYKLNY